MAFTLKIQALMEEAEGSTLLPLEPSLMNDASLGSVYRLLFKSLWQYQDPRHILPMSNRLHNVCTTNQIDRVYKIWSLSPDAKERKRTMKHMFGQSAYHELMYLLAQYRRERGM